MNKTKYSWLYSIILLIPIWGINLLQLVVRVKAIKDDYLIYTSVFIALMLTLICTLLLYPCRTGNLKKPKFSLPLCVCWITMCLLMLYSDIIVFKKYWFLSLILLVLFTGVFYCLAQYSASNRDKLWTVFTIAIEVAFIFTVVFCLLFRPYTPGVRYNALSANPNVYAMFIVSVWACLLTKADNHISSQVSYKKTIFTCIELGFAGHFLYMTGARTSFLAILFITLVWFCFRFVLSRKTGKNIMKYVLVGLPIIIVSFFVSYILLATLPNIINKPVVFERDREFLSLDNDNVCLANSDMTHTLVEAEKDAQKALENAANEPSLFKRFTSMFKDGSSLDTILNGRLSIYKSYLEKADAIGHEKYGKKVDGVYTVNAHNNIIQMAYSYGYPAMFAYILLNILSIIYSIKYYITFHDKKRNAVFPALITAGFLITSLTECILIPMQSLLAFSYYLTIGELMNANKK